jgi:hypothetical protein
MGQVSPVNRRPAPGDGAAQSSPPAAARVHEPDMDMKRGAGGVSPAVRAAETWYRKVASALSLAWPEGMIRRPSRAIDREYQEFGPCD